MISAWNLLWIIPLMSFITVAAIALVGMIDDDNEESKK